MSVCFWHKADIPQLSSKFAIGGKVDITRTCSDVRF